MKHTTNHQILIGVFVGLFIGLYIKLNPYAIGSDLIIYLADLVADIFVSSLKMVLIPVIFFSISVGIANLSGHKQSSRIWFLTFSFFFISMALAIILGFGSMNLFDPGPRTATATAVVDSRLLTLANDQVIGWVTAHPEVSLQLLGRLAQRLRKANDVLSDLVFADVPGRVAKAIIELGERFGTKKDDGLHVNHELTQEELAQLVGASRETVNKALADFASRGWVKLEPRAVIVLDYERLVKRGR